VGQWVGAQGRPKFPKHAFFVTSPPEISPPKTKDFFFNFDYKTWWIRGWFR